LTPVAGGLWIKRAARANGQLGKREGPMRVTFGVAMGLAAFFVTAAAADDYPPRKPGLWEVVSHNAALPEVNMKMCIDSETDQLFHKFSSNIRSKHCEKNDIKVAGDTVQTETICSLGGTKVTTSSVTKFTGDAAYHVDITTHFDPPKLGQSEITATQDAKWVSDCPADMKPGDFDMGHGIRVNIKTINMLKSLMPGHSNQ
jgi:hypothetical protein